MQVQNLRTNVPNASACFVHLPKPFHPLTSPCVPSLPFSTPASMSTPQGHSEKIPITIFQGGMQVVANLHVPHQPQAAAAPKSAGHQVASGRSWERPINYIRGLSRYFLRIFETDLLLSYAFVTGCHEGPPFAFVLHWSRPWLELFQRLVAACGRTVKGRATNLV